MDLYSILKQLNFERLAGSEDEIKARNLLKSYLDSYGLSYSEHSFELNTFKTGNAEISAKNLKIEGLPLGLSQSVEVSGELYFMENSEQIYCQTGMYKDKIILTNTRSPKLADKLKSEQVAGVIYITKPYRDLNANNLRQRNYEEGTIPAVYILYEDARKLASLSGEKITLKIEQQTSKEKAVNLVVDIPGTGEDKTLTCLCAHYDTVATSVGACDNSAGTVIILKIAEHFSKNKPLRDLRILFFSCEEMGLLGSWAYTKEFKEELKQRMGILINVDVSGDDIAIDTVSTIGTKEHMGYVDGIFKEEGLFFKNELEIYSSDCMPFSVIEIPSINLARGGGSCSYHIHTKNDSIENVTQRGLETTFNATKILCERLLNAKIYPMKAEIDDSLKDKIEKYVFSSTLVEPKLEWKKKYEK